MDHQELHGVRVARCTTPWDMLANYDDKFAKQPNQRLCRRCGVTVYKVENPHDHLPAVQVDQDLPVPPTQHLYRRFDGTFTRDARRCGIFPNLEDAAILFAVSSTITIAIWALVGLSLHMWGWHFLQISMALNLAGSCAPAVHPNKVKMTPYIWGA